MDIDDYVYQIRKKNPKYNFRKLAEDIGTTYQTLLHIRRKKSLPSSNIMIKLHKYSDGKIDVWKLLNDCYNHIELLGDNEQLL